jgi:hypothetical protein
MILARDRHQKRCACRLPYERLFAGVLGLLCLSSAVFVPAAAQNADMSKRHAADRAGSSPGGAGGSKDHAITKENGGESGAAAENSASSGRHWRPERNGFGEGMRFSGGTGLGMGMGVPGVGGDPAAMARRGAISMWLAASTPMTEILLIPSLTKAQQARLRQIYLGYRKRSADMATGFANEAAKKESDIRQHAAVASKAGGSGSAEKPATSWIEDSSQTANGQAPAIDVDRLKQAVRDAVSENLKFSADILAVLTKSQQKELRAIGMKTGSPDYFEKLAQDKERLEMAKSSGQKESSPKPAASQKQNSPKPATTQKRANTTSQ